MLLSHSPVPKEDRIPSIIPESARDVKIIGLNQGYPLQRKKKLIINPITQKSRGSIQKIANIYSNISLSSLSPMKLR
jgi:hypothetical protein